MGQGYAPLRVPWKMTACERKSMDWSGGHVGMWSKDFMRLYRNNMDIFLGDFGALSSI